METSSRVIDAARLGLAPLWTTGRLEALLRRPWIRRAMDAHDAITRSLIAACALARDAGEKTFTASVSLADEDARSWLALAREVRASLQDGDALLRAGGPDLTPEERALAVTLIDHAERAIAGDAERREDGSDDSQTPAT